MPTKEKKAELAAAAKRRAESVTPPIIQAPSATTETATSEDEAAEHNALHDAIIRDNKL